jgi:hypothetical protein
MKKLILAFAIICTSAAVNAQDLKTNYSEDSSFTADCPQDWESRAESYGKNNNITFQSPKPDGAERSEAFISVGREPVKKGVTTIQAAMAPQMAMFKKQIGSNMKENKIVNGKQIFVFTMKEGKKPLKTKMVAWVNKGYMYIGTYGTESANFEKYLKNAEAIFASVKVLK